jgi:hypothetical protein
LVPEGLGWFLGDPLGHGLSINEISIEVGLFFRIGLIVFVELIGVVLFDLGIGLLGFFAEGLIHFVAVHLVEALVVIDVAIEVRILHFLHLVVFSSIAVEAVFAVLTAEDTAGLFFGSGAVVDVDLVTVLLAEVLLGGIHVNAVVFSQSDP